MKKSENSLSAALLALFLLPRPRLVSVPTGTTCPFFSLPPRGKQMVAASLFDAGARHHIEWQLHWLLRIALCAEFIGHGVFGVMTKQAWVPYFTVMGFPESWAWTLMPVVGSIDITLGVLALVLPTRGALLYMGCWGFFTALLRPIAGEAWWEFVERSYNYGLPWLMLWMHRWPSDYASWLRPITHIPRLTLKQTRVASYALRGIMAAMLIGHGAFGLVMNKPNLLRFYDAAGLGGFGMSLPEISAAIGAFEMLLGIACLAAVRPSFFLCICAWKLGTEFLYVPAQAYGAWWEVLERGGSYAAPLLWICLQPLLRESETAGAAFSRSHRTEVLASLGTLAPPAPQSAALRLHPCFPRSTWRRARRAPQSSHASRC